MRALDILAGADCIYAEDTRVARRLLEAYGLEASVKPYHDHNGAEARPAILSALKAGATFALVSDAGTPLISDPGYKLVREAIAQGVAVTVAPGPSAALAALALAGLPSDAFAFIGFPPPKSAARRKAFAVWRDAPATLVMYEGPSRLAACLADLLAVLGDRPAVVARELTKLYEEARRGGLSDLAAHYAEAGPPKGEIVVLVGPPEGPAAAPQPEEIDAALRDALAVMKPKTAASLVADRFGLPSREVYARALALKDGPDRR